jgi:hypothetical protein
MCVGNYCMNQGKALWVFPTLQTSCSSGLHLPGGRNVYILDFGSVQWHQAEGPFIYLVISKRLQVGLKHSYIHKRIARILLVYIKGTLASGKFLPQQRMKGALLSSQINHSYLFIRANFYFSFCWVGEDFEGGWEFLCSTLALCRALTHKTVPLHGP